MEGMLQSSVLYVIKLGFEMVNAKFFRILDKNALTTKFRKSMDEYQLRPTTKFRKSMDEYQLRPIKCMDLLEDVDSFYLFIFVPF